MASFAKHSNPTLPAVRTGWKLFRRTETAPLEVFTAESGAVRLATCVLRYRCVHFSLHTADPFSSKYSTLRL